MHSSPTVEVVLFKLKPGINEAAFLQASDQVTPILRNMSGFQNRTLLKDQHGQWIDIVYWRSLDEAQAAAQAIMAEPGAQPMMSMLDETSITMHHLEHVRGPEVISA